MSLLAYIDDEADVHDRRTSPRRRLRLAIKGTTAFVDSIQVTIHDLSEGGLLLESPFKLSNGECLEVELPGQGPTLAKVVWSSEHFAGCQFATSISSDAVSTCLRESTKLPASDTSPEMLSNVAIQLEELSQAMLRIGKVVDRAIDHLNKRYRS